MQQCAWLGEFDDPLQFRIAVAGIERDPGLAGCDHGQNRDQVFDRILAADADTRLRPRIFGLEIGGNAHDFGGEFRKRHAPVRRDDRNRVRRALRRAKEKFDRLHQARPRIVTTVAASSTPKKPPPFSAAANRASDDLPRAGLTAQLHHEFMNLDRAGRADRMALRHKSARRIDRNAAAEPCLAALGHRSAFAWRAQSEIFGLQDFGIGRGVVDFGNAQVFRADAGLRIGAVGRDVTEMTRKIVMRAVGAAHQRGGHHLNGAIFARTAAGHLPNRQRARRRHR